MWENQENQNPAENTEAEVVKPTYEELENNLSLMTAQLDSARRNADHFVKLVATRNSQVESLEDYLKENWESLDTHAEEIAEIFDIEVTSTKAFKMTIEVEVEVTANSPAYDWSNFDGSEFDFDVSASIGYHSRTDLNDVTVDRSDVIDCEEN